MFHNVSDLCAGDVCDDDDDNDGLNDLEDNCQYDYNRDQNDTDIDLIGSQSKPLFYVRVRKTQHCQRTCRESENLSLIRRDSG